MQLNFLGAAGEFAGSCFLVQTGGTRFLVNCGMVQGAQESATSTRQPFAFDPASIDFVLLSHAHIDHSGLLPELTRSGFKGPIYTTETTADLLGVMLPASADIWENSAIHQAKQPMRQRSLPMLCTPQDAPNRLKQVRSTPYDREFEPHNAVRCRFRDAGNILGSAIIEIWVSEYGLATKLVFSGDLSQPEHTILRDPTPIDEADILFIESTYGNRVHEDQAATEAPMAWTRSFHKPPAQTFVMPGERAAAQALANALRCGRNWRVTVPENGKTQEWLNFLTEPLRTRNWISL